MSDTILTNCKICGYELDCINGMCENCYIKELEKDDLIDNLK